jgi:cytochrome P450
LQRVRFVAGNTAHRVPPLPEDVVADEVGLRIFAGTDTTSVALSCL